MTKVYGQVAKDGNLVLGTGFNSSRIDTSHYSVQFSTAFSSEPMILLTAIEDNGEARIITLAKPSAKGFEVYCKNSGGGRRDVSFNFYALSY